MVAYLRAFGLIFGAFDFSVTPDGRWWFLECNPAGQWGWLTEETGLPIADELVRAA
jgi:D-alanine-D-alanine ligase-like ATP-grasp enzyme